MAVLETGEMSGSDSTVAGEDGAIVLSTQPSGAVAHILMLTLWLGIPVWLVLSQPGWFEYLISAGWLLVFGRTLWSVVAIDSQARFEVRDQRVRVSNINPLVKVCRRVIPFRFRWEGEFAWSEIQNVRVENRIHTRSLESNVVYLVTLAGKKLPAAGFDKEPIAHGVADILREMLGLREPSLPR